MATSGGSSSALHAQNSSNSGGAQGGNPRKFAEKIQILNIKGAEETAEFEKIMSECAAVRVGQQNYQSDNVTSQVIDGQKNRTMNMKSSNFAPQVSGQVRASSPSNSGFPNIYAGGTGVIVTSTGTRHLSPAPFNSIVHRHGSMPNMAPLPGGSGVGNLTNKSPVGDLPAMLKQYNMTNPASIKREPQVLHQQGNLETIARISEIISVSPVPSMSTASCTTLVDGNQPSRKLPGNQTSQQYHNNRTRLNTTPSASTGSGIPGSSNSPGPIRNRQRRHETSPFERKSIAPEYAGIESNRRESGGSTSSNISAQHLSPPDLSVRRFYSDPSLHQTVNGVQQVSSQDQTNPVSDTSGSQTIVPTQVNQDPINQNISFGNTLGGVSPLENASPTIARRVVGDPTQDANQMQGVGNVTNAYVQMVNRGDSHKASSPDCRVLTTRHPPIAGQGISYLPLPGGISEGPHGSGDNLTVTQNSGAFIPGGGGKPSGSLPDLTNFHVNSQSPSPCSGPNIASGESSNGQAMPFSQSLSTAAVCSPNYSPSPAESQNSQTSGENSADGMCWSPESNSNGVATVPVAILPGYIRSKIQSPTQGSNPSFNVSSHITKVPQTPSSAPPIPILIRTDEDDKTLKDIFFPPGFSSDISVVHTLQQHQLLSQKHPLSSLIIAKQEELDNLCQQNDPYFRNSSSPASVAKHLQSLRPVFSPEIANLDTKDKENKGENRGNYNDASTAQQQASVAPTQNEFRISQLKSVANGPTGTPRNANVNTNGNAKLTLGRFLNNKDAQRQTVQYSTNQPSTGNANILAQQHNTCGPGHPAEDNSSPTLTYQHPNTAKSVVRLSDNEISEILSLPIALVSENHYSGDPALSSGSTSSNVATSAATSDSSIISPNNDAHQLPNSNGRNGTGANDVFLNKNIHSNNNNNSINIKSEPICDNSLEFLNPIQNVINLNKSVDMDQSDGGMMNEENQSMFFGASSNVDFVGGQNNPEQNYSNKVFAQNGDGGLNNYRNPQPIPTAHSPSNHIQGGSSPFGARSTSPIDISSLTGSPHHSPNPRCNPLPSIGSLESGGSIPGGGTNGYSVGTYGSASSPGYSSDMMISAGGVGGGSIGTQMDLGLSKEFQRFTVTEPGSQHQVGMYFPSSPAQTQHGQQMPQQHSLNYHNSHQPLHDWMNGGNQNHLGVDGGGNGGIDIGNNQQSNASMPSPNPQTPSSIPDILISRCGDDSGPDQTLQRLIAMGEFDNDSMFSEELRADLGKLDDNMIRLLEDNVQMDQNIADAVTEEHLKL